MRLFVALTPPEDVVDRLEDIQGEIPLGRLVPRENLHLTLAFLGEISRADAEALHDALCATGLPATDIAFTSLGTFGHPDPVSLHAAAAVTPSLTALHRKLRGAAHAAGLMPDRERFHPHVTLARFGRGLGPDSTTRLARLLSVWGVAEVPGFTGDRVTLFESHLSKDGARYHALAEYPLAPPR